MPEPVKKKRFALPREVRIILSVGNRRSNRHVDHLVLPQFSSARKSLHLLATVNPILVIAAVLLEMATMRAYMGLTKSVLYPYAPSRYNLLRVNLAGLAISHVVPGGTAPAGALSYRILNELGVPKDTNAFGLAVQGTGSAIVFEHDLPGSRWLSRFRCAAAARPTASRHWPASFCWPRSRARWLISSRGQRSRGQLAPVDQLGAYRRSTRRRSTR